MQIIAEWSLRFLDEHAQLALFVWLLLEEAGLPMPLPGDFIVLAGGARLGQGGTHWVVPLALVALATVLGSTALFWLSRRGGRPLLLRYGRFFQLDAERLARFEAILQRRGFLAVVIGRLTPGLRVATTVAAGALGVPYRQFLPASLVGSNNLVLLLVGYFAGPEILRVMQDIQVSPRLIGAVAGVVLLLAAHVYVRKRAGLTAAATNLSAQVRVETAVIAGVGATATTFAVVNVALYLTAAIDLSAPSDALLQLVRGVALRSGAIPLAGLLAIGALLYLGLHIGWALVYAYVEPRLPEPDWVGGLVFAAAPLALSLFVILPVLGAGVAGLSLGAGYVPLAGEILRNTIYGWALSTAYTVLSQARRPRRARSQGIEPVSA